MHYIQGVTFKITRFVCVGHFLSIFKICHSTVRTSLISVEHYFYILNGIWAIQDTRWGETPCIGIFISIPVREANRRLAFVRHNNSARCRKWLREMILRIGLYHRLQRHHRIPNGMGNELNKFVWATKRISSVRGRVGPGKSSASVTEAGDARWEGNCNDLKWIALFGLLGG